MKKITHYALRITNCISGSSEKQCVIRNAQCAMKKITHYALRITNCISGASVAVTNATFDNVVTADVDSSTITATNVNINARDDHKSNETVVSAALSTGLAVSVNRMSTSINNGLANLNENQLGNALSSGDLTMTPSNASKTNADSDGDKLTGEYGAESRYLNEEAVNSLLSGVRAPKSSTQDLTLPTAKAGGIPNSTTVAPRLRLTWSPKA